MYDDAGWMIIDGRWWCFGKEAEAESTQTTIPIAHISVLPLIYTLNSTHNTHSMFIPECVFVPLVQLYRECCKKLHKSAIRCIEKDNKKSNKLAICLFEQLWYDKQTLSISEDHCIDFLVASTEATLYNFATCDSIGC